MPQIFGVKIMMLFDMSKEMARLFGKIRGQFIRRSETDDRQISI